MLKRTMTLALLAMLLTGWTTSSAADPLPSDANLSDVLRAYPGAAAEMDTLRHRWADERRGLERELADLRLAGRLRIADLRADSVMNREALRLLNDRYQAERPRWYTSPQFMVPVVAVITVWATLQAVKVGI